MNKEEKGIQNGKGVTHGGSYQREMVVFLEGLETDTNPVIHFSKDENVKGHKICVEGVMKISRSFRQHPHEDRLIEGGGW